MTTFAENHARYLDPPDPPERAKCAGCGEVFTYDDMKTIDWKDYCRECAEKAEAEKEANDYELWLEENIGADMEDE